MLSCIVNFENVRDDILFYLQNMLKEIENKSPGYEFICQDLMDVLVILLNHKPISLPPLHPFAKSPPSFAQPCAAISTGIFQKICRWILWHSLCMSANITWHTPLHRNMQFLQSTYMLACRIDEGKKLLKNDDFSLLSSVKCWDFLPPAIFHSASKN